MLTMQGRQIIIADNQDIVRLGLTALIREVLSDVPCLVVKEVTRASDLIDLLKQESHSVVVIDIGFFRLSSEELYHLSNCFSDTMWILFCDGLSELYLRQIIDKERFSIVYKDNSAHEIATALKYAVTGVKFLCHQVTNILLSLQSHQSPLERDGLTSTEMEVLKLIALGKSVKEIAAERN
ncbi:MAG: DNA-binding response regulator, partial [Bacteroidaceae bacterium]